MDSILDSTSNDARQRLFWTRNGNFYQILSDQELTKPKHRFWLRENPRRPWTNIGYRLSCNYRVLNGVEKWVLDWTQLWWRKSTWESIAAGLCISSRVGAHRPELLDTGRWEPARHWITQPSLAYLSRCNSNWTPEKDNRKTSLMNSIFWFVVVLLFLNQIPH